MEKLILKNLSIGPSLQCLVKDINAELVVGTVTALIGNNGTGKTCLLKTLGRLIKSREGDMFIDQQNMTSFSRQDLSKLLAIVLTDKIEAAYITVDELLSMGRAPYTNWKNELSTSDKKIINHYCEIFSLKEILYAQFHLLSDGQKQKVLIAKAFIQETPFILLDEPTNYLDFQLKKIFYKFLRNLAKEEKKAILISSHDYHFLNGNVDCYWLIDDNKKLIIKGDSYDPLLG